ncbi:MAG: malonyl-ACP O-methyltransferase BioC [Ectothiorhodospiraceae bacterium]|nr:malonyl-ACP O-methyltransferase BioC [Chromatiales bacterium]MCP5156499.1 malonyl-ACP O-methyltransferase BioC [Ectothiorhodospiraceae bacterium]
MIPPEPPSGAHAPPVEYAVDKRRARKAAERAVLTYDDHAVVATEVGRRLLDHLDLIRIDPARILDVGCATGSTTTALAARYPRATVLAVDHALPMLRAHPTPRRLSFRPRRRIPVCADLEALPFADAGFDLVVSNATLHWSSRPDRSLHELTRVLAPGGLLMLSAYGPDTLGELRRAWAAVDAGVHVHVFTDMHDLGDAMVRARLADVVVESDRITVEYRDLDGLVRDLRGQGATNAATGRGRGLKGARARNRLVAAYDRLRSTAGALPATYEIVYAHAWRPRAAAEATPPRGSHDVQLRR